MTPIALERYKDGPEGDMQRERNIKFFQSMPLLKCPHPDCDFKNIYQESVDHHMKYKHPNTDSAEKEVGHE